LPQIFAPNFEKNLMGFFQNLGQKFGAKKLNGIFSKFGAKI
jgi:hypothetical protein